MKTTITIFIIFVALACSNSKTKTKITTTETTVALAKDTQIILPKEIEEELELFSNLEQIEYCIPLPLDEYSETFNADNEKAQHTFIHETKKKNEISVQGFIRENVAVSIEDYFKNTFANAEEEGKIILQTKLLKDNNCFYATGYWSNFIYEFRFTEIYWLRKDEMVKLSSTYNINDTTTWNSRREQIIKASSICK